MNFGITVKYYLFNEVILASLMLFKLRPQKVENWGKVVSDPLRLLFNFVIKYLLVPSSEILGAFPQLLSLFESGF